MTTETIDFTGVKAVLVEDDDAFRESLAENLRGFGMEVQEFAEGAAAMRRLSSGGVDLMLLDWRLPDVNGLQVLRKARETLPDTPAVFLTVMSSEMYEEAALVQGATDFIDKSRSFSILLHRLGLALRSRGDADAPPEDAGPLEIDLARHRVSWRGHRIPLTLSEARIVETLAARAGQEVSYMELFEAAHPAASGSRPSSGQSTSVRSAIKRIRQKFREVDPEFDAVKLYPKFGYRWDGESAS